MNLSFIRIRMIALLFVVVILSPSYGFQMMESSRSIRILPRCSHPSIGQQRTSGTKLWMSLYNRIKSSVQRKFPDGNIVRVVDCWDRFVEGKNVEQYVDPPNNLILQKADCYVQGLSATCFHDMKIHPWALQLEEKHAEILAELQAYHGRYVTSTAAVAPLSTASTAGALGIVDAAGEWLPPRDSAGNSYGPEWKTLGLQDRSVWDDDRVKEFPKTVRILKDLDVPSCEVFFAKQGPKSGIKPHSDKNNFIITCHLALDVPEGECWIQVGDQKYFWKVCIVTFFSSISRMLITLVLVCCLFVFCLISPAEWQKRRVRYQHNTLHGEHIGSSAICVVDPVLAS